MRTMSEGPSARSVARYDVVIVGASIAGCTTATFLGRAGASVALIDSHDDPSAFKRVCTHYIQPSAAPTIERLGLTEAIKQAGGVPSGANLWTRYGWIEAHGTVASPAGDHPAWNIRRQTLDPMVRELAAATAGVKLLLGHTATAVLRERATGGGEGRVNGIVAQSRDGAEHQLRARLVVAADGRESPVAKLVGRPPKYKKHNRFGYWAYYRDTPLLTGSGMQMWLLDPDIAYAFPTDAGLTILACMPSKQRLSEFKGDPERAMARVFERLPDAPRLDPTKRESKVIGKLEMPNAARRPHAPGLAFVGDAALASDPLWGVGCGFALQSAEWLADTVAPALGGDHQALDRALERYGRIHHKRLGPHDKLCSAYSTGRKFNTLEKLLYRGAARDRELAGRLHLMAGRWITPQQMLTPATLAGLMRVNASRSRRPSGLTTAEPAPARVAI